VMKNQQFHVWSCVYFTEIRCNLVVSAGLQSSLRRSANWLFHFKDLIMIGCFAEVRQRRRTELLGM
jgi:hypothetical protein